MKEVASSRPPLSAVPPGKVRQPRTVGGMRLGQDSSREARRLAAAILEVLAGLRTPTDAAQAVGLSVTRYYQVESRALAGLLQACEPRAKGRQPSAAAELAQLRQQQQRLQRDLARQQALVRLGQRSIGLAPPTPVPAKAKGSKKRRKPVSRALQVAGRLHVADPAVPETPVPGPDVSLQQPQ